MSKGICISIGLNAVDPAHYEGWSGVLNACENDARDIAQITQARGLSSKLLLTKQATSISVLSELEAAAKSLGQGDLLVLYYSGHGGQVGDANADEADQLDETWCLFDRMLIDDELYSMWSKFKAGVHVLVLSDSCHSGTVTKTAFYSETLMAPSLQSHYKSLPQMLFKAAPFDTTWRAYQTHKTLYDTVQYLSGAAEKSSVSASVLLISGCQDNQLSSDGNPNSLFTAMLKRVWNGGQFEGSYKMFHKAIIAQMPPSQTPNFFTVGPVSMEFEAQQPFKI